LKSSLPPPRHGLYAITNGPRDDLLDVVTQALEGGVRMLQYRDPGSDSTRRHDEAAALREFCQVHSVPLIIDQDIALAQAVGADGVHLDSERLLPAAREALGAGAIIGVACGDSMERAQLAARAGADYISFGVIFPSPTKPLAPRAPIELLRQSAALGIPRVAIGGITPDNGALLVEEGADYLGAISSLFGAVDVRATAQHFARLYSSTPGTTA
jgi:thiamine-phosphate pyrophosphorylase